MIRIADQVEDLENQLDDAHSRIESLKEDIYTLRDERDDMYEELKQLRAYIEWFEATYPEARVAYEVAERVS